MAGKKKTGSKKQNNRPSNNSTDLARAAASSASTRSKSQSNSKQGKKKTGFFSGIIAYFRGVRQEFSKVVWPTREELITNTAVVFATVIFFSLAFWLIDTGFLAALKGILGITLS